MFARSYWGVGLIADAEAEGHLINTDKFEELQYISTSLQFQALFALLNKHPLRLEDGLDIFFSLDDEQALEVSSHELLEECTNPRNHACQELLRQAADAPSLSLELLTDRARVLPALQRLNRQGDGVITLDEWKEFLAELLEKDLNFAIMKAWASGLVYFGHNCATDLTPLLPVSTFNDPVVPPATAAAAAAITPHQEQHLHHQQALPRTMLPPLHEHHRQPQQSQLHSLLPSLPHINFNAQFHPARRSGGAEETRPPLIAGARCDADSVMEQQALALSSLEEQTRCGTGDQVDHKIALPAVVVGRPQATAAAASPSAHCGDSTQAFSEVGHNFHELSVLVVFNRHYDSLRLLLLVLLGQWGKWRGAAGAPAAGAGAGGFWSRSGGSFILAASATRCLGAVSGVRGALLLPWRRLESALRSSFLGNPAWRADFLYYEKNMNPVFGLFFCDPQHPLTFLERLDIEFCVYGWVFFTSALFALTKQSREQNLRQGEQLEEYRYTNANKYLASFLLVSAPSMLLRVFLFYIFLCPCIVVRRKKKRSLFTKVLFPLLEGVGHAVGVVTFVFSLCLYGFGFMLMMDLSSRSREIFLLSYTAGWGVTNFFTYLVWDFCIYFNPFLCCVPSLSRSQPGGSSAVAGASSVGAGAGAGAGAGVDFGAEGQLHCETKKKKGRASVGLRARAVTAALLRVAGQCLLWLGVAQWQVERLRARDRLHARALLLQRRDSISPRAQRLLSRVSSKPKLSVDVKKLQ